MTELVLTRTNEMIDPVLHAWREASAEPPQYPAGAWGPAEADLFIARDRHRWRQYLHNYRQQYYDQLEHLRQQ